MTWIAMFFSALVGLVVGLRSAEIIFELLALATKKGRRKFFLKRVEWKWTHWRGRTGKYRCIAVLRTTEQAVKPALYLFALGWMFWWLEGWATGDHWALICGFVGGVVFVSFVRVNENEEFEARWW